MYHILVTLNENYLYPLKVMLRSFADNNPGRPFTVHLIHSGLRKADLVQLEALLAAEGNLLDVITVPENFFADAPTLKHYTREMYYRLLAYRLLPPDLDRVLYLDPDIVVLNPIEPLYGMDLGDHFFAAAEHADLAMREVNRLRLKNPEAKGYFNTGVLLMNLDLLRREADTAAIISYIQENHDRLLLPDQDVLNALFGHRVCKLDFFRYNFDARRLALYRLKYDPELDVDWINGNTVFLHYCGKRKPWHKNYIGNLGFFFDNYARRLAQAEQDLEVYPT